MNSALATVAVQPRKIPCPTHVPGAARQPGSSTLPLHSPPPLNHDAHDQTTLSITDNLRAVHVGDIGCLRVAGRLRDPWETGSARVGYRPVATPSGC